MFETALKKEGDVWDVINIASGELLPDSAAQYQGIVITGSHYNCRDREKLAWFDGLCGFISQAAEKGSPRIYGGCFGCQIIAFALGGAVDYNPGQQFALKAETITLNQPNFEQNLPHSDPDQDKLSSLNIIVSHGECVTTLPPSAELLATSASCVHEMFVAGPLKNILCCQSHPEFDDVDYAIHQRIAPVVIGERKRLSDEQVKETMDSLAKYTGVDAKLFMNLVSDFLHK
jgi:GMP synthase (glutamine-hydrolysing)